MSKSKPKASLKKSTSKSPVMAKKVTPKPGYAVTEVKFDGKRKAVAPDGPKLALEAQKAGISLKQLDQIQAEAVAFEQLSDLARRATALDADLIDQKAEVRSTKKAIDEIHAEMRKIALQKQPALPFKAQPGKSPIKSADAVRDGKIDDAAFETDLAAASLKDIGIAPAKTIEALEGFGIKTGADLRKWIQAHPTPPKIQGIGTGAQDKISDALAKWSTDWVAVHPAKPAEAASATALAEKHTAAGDKPGEATRGAAVVRARKELEDEITKSVKSLGVKDTDEGFLKIGKYLVGSPTPVQAIETASLGLIETWLETLRKADTASLQDIIAGKAGEPGNVAAPAA